MKKNCCTKMKLALIGLSLLFSAYQHAEEIELTNKIDEQSENIAESKKRNFDDDCCNTTLKFKNLCAKKIKSNCGDFNKLNANDVCAKTLNVPNACVNTLSVQDKLCVDKLGANNACLNNLNVQNVAVQNTICGNINAPKICVDHLQANDFCSTGSTKVNSFENCQKFRATMTFKSNVLYTLGSIIEWDTILDDPNGNISLVPDSTYTAPKSGYYIVTLQLDQNNIVGANQIVGVPVANLELLVNNKLFRQTFVPYLSFHNEQKANISGLLSLNAGDKVTAKYNVLVMNDVTGFTNYVGTVNVLGTGVEENGSVFKIHYLSSDCKEAPCQPCAIPCLTGLTGCNFTCNLTGCNIPCIPCTPTPPVCPTGCTPCDQ